MLSLDVVVA